MKEKAKLILNEYLIKNNKGGILNTWLEEENRKHPMYEYYRLFIESIINEEISTISAPKYLPSIYFDFIDSHFFNLSAINISPFYFIGFNQGGLILLIDLFNRMLSHKNILPDIGDVDKEIINSPTIKNYYTDCDLFLDLGSTKEENINVQIPKCPIRQKYAKFLTELSIEFLIHHEMAHILNGHLKFSSQLFNIDNETKYKEIKMSPLIKQALEFDADCAGSSLCIYNHLTILTGSKPVNTDYASFYLEPDKVLFSLFFSILTLFRLQNPDQSFLKSPIESITYPPTRVRTIYSISCIEEAISNFYKGKNPFKLKFNTLFLESLKQSEEAYSKLTGIPYNNEGDLRSEEELERENDKGKIHFLQIKEQWQIIRGDILPFAFREIP